MIPRRSWHGSCQAPLLAWADSMSEAGMRAHGSTSRLWGPVRARIASWLHARAPGHHEAEFGMSWCAGFGGEFWKGYRSVLPQDPGACPALPLALPPRFAAAVALAFWGSQAAVTGGLWLRCVLRRLPRSGAPLAARAVPA